MNEKQYIQDAFTKVGANTNLEVNNLTVDCIASKNNQFELDSEGNLTVKKITAEEILNTQMEIDILNKVYPVGSIYMSMNNVHPASLFGGTWERISKGRTFIGVDEEDADFNVVGKAGGSKEMQRHCHSATNFVYNAIGYIDLPSGVGQKLATADSSVHIDYAGEGDSGNLQPYLTCYIWERTA